MQYNIARTNTVRLTEYADIFYASDTMAIKHSRRTYYAHTKKTKRNIKLECHLQSIWCSDDFGVVLSLDLC